MGGRSVAVLLVLPLFVFLFHFFVDHFDFFSSSSFFPLYLQLSSLQREGPSQWLTLVGKQLDQTPWPTHIISNGEKRGNWHVYSRLVSNGYLTITVVCFSFLASDCIGIGGKRASGEIARKMWRKRSNEHTQKSNGLVDLTGRVSSAVLPFAPSDWGPSSSSDGSKASTIGRSHNI